MVMLEFRFQDLPFPKAESRMACRVSVFRYPVKESFWSELVEVWKYARVSRYSVLHDKTGKRDSKDTLTYSLPWARRAHE